MTIISRDLLRDYMFSRGCMPFDGFMIADRTYALPARDWIYSDFARAWSMLLAQLRLRQWQPEANDCDNFARLAASWASVLHNKTPDRPEAEIALGEFWFERDRGGGHAINFAVVTQAPLQAQSLEELRYKADLAFFEPQTSEEIQLTSTEIQSCTGFRI